VRKLRQVPLRWVLAGVFVAFAGDWIVFLTAGDGQCGNADTVECTSVGWVLLYGWLILGTATVVLATFLLGRSVRRSLSGRRSR
jgi:hypothetical protein